MKSAVRQLVTLSRRYGRDPKLVQAAGGNISIKGSARHFVIKASGARLREVNASKGWTTADRPAIVRGLRRLARIANFSKRELAYAGLLTRASRPRSRRVSMEAGFHAGLSDVFVIHLHSIAGVLLGAAPRSEARRLLSGVVPGVEVRFVEASVPGYELTRLMLDQAGKTAGKPTLWIQCNHGVAWCGDRLSELTAFIERFERAFRRRWTLNDYEAPHVLGRSGCRHRRKPLASATPGGALLREVCFCRWPRCRLSAQPLFPDFAVYFDLWSNATPDLRVTGPRTALLSASTASALADKQEVLYAHALVTTLLKHFGWKASFPRSMVHQIKSLESERLRLKQAGRL